MTYNVFNGTLSHTQSINQSIMQIKQLLQCIGPDLASTMSGTSIVYRHTSLVNATPAIRTSECHMLIIHVYAQ